MPTVRRFWIEFDLENETLSWLDLCQGVGVTGFDERDFLSMVADLFDPDTELPPVRRITVDISLAEKLPVHPPALGVPVWRGVWYPPRNFGPGRRGGLGVSTERSNAPATRHLSQVRPPRGGTKSHISKDVSSWGIPWWDKPPTLAGKGLSSFAAGLSFLALAAAAWFHIRPHARLRVGSTADRLARIPVLAVSEAVMVLFLVGAFVKAAVAQYPSYSIAKSNLSTAFRSGCGLADDVLVETDPNASMLSPVSGDAGSALTADGCAVAVGEDSVFGQLGDPCVNLWQGHEGGGPLGWTQLLFTARTMPAYLDNDWDRDWGSIEQFIPLVPDIRPATITHEDVHRSGTWTPGHIITSY